MKTSELQTIQDNVKRLMVLQKSLDLFMQKLSLDTKQSRLSSLKKRQKRLLKLSDQLVKLLEY